MEQVNSPLPGWGRLIPPTRRQVNNSKRRRVSSQSVMARKKRYVREVQGTEIRNDDLRVDDMLRHRGATTYVRKAHKPPNDQVREEFLEELLVRPLPFSTDNGGHQAYVRSFLDSTGILKMELSTQDGKAVDLHELRTSVPPSSPTSLWKSAVDLQEPKGSVRTNPRELMRPHWRMNRKYLNKEGVEASDSGRIRNRILTIDEVEAEMSAQQLAHENRKKKLVESGFSEEDVIAKIKRELEDSDSPDNEDHILDLLDLEPSIITPHLRGFMENDCWNRETKAYLGRKKRIHRKIKQTRPEEYAILKSRPRLNVQDFQLLADLFDFVEYHRTPIQTERLAKELGIDGMMEDSNARNDLTRFTMRFLESLAFKYEDEELTHELEHMESKLDNRSIVLDKWAEGLADSDRWTVDEKLIKLARARNDLNIMVSQNLIDSIDEFVYRYE
eukprot:GHVH01017485.1.p1 GENE.GHVH01017485.1~~GHVH01017485.1.p1  ORF type:complete len:444 (+),score=63.92 GHVH01017485.1:200-1531(+)